MIVNSKWVFGLACLLLVPVGGCSSANADPAKDSAAQAANEEGKSVASKTDDKPFVVPKDATPDELLEFVFELVQRPPASDTKEARIAHGLKLARATLEATERILNAKNISEKVALEALDWRFAAYSVLVDLEQPDAEKARLELAKKYIADSNPKLATMAKGKLLLINLENMKQLKPTAQTALVADAIDYLKGTGTPDQRMFKNVVRLGNFFEHGGNDLVAAQAYDEFANLFAHSSDRDAEPLADRLRKMAGRMRMVGKPLEIEGQTTTGQPIDWASYRGKVVLVDFWATWCPTCVKELPDLVKLREEFGAKGFDVIGVNNDDNRRALDKFLAQNELPWSNLYDENHEMHPLSEKYGVVGLPVNMLVGKDGKVIKLNLHGAELRETLEKMLGKPVEAKPK